MLCDDVINDVVRPGSTMREDHICTPYKGTLYVGRGRSISRKNHDVTLMTSSDTWCHRQHAQWIALGHFPIGYSLETSRYLA